MNDVRQPDVSKQALEAAEGDILSYRERFENEAPAHFKGLFLDVDKAIPLLEKSLVRRTTLFELSVYTLFVALLTWLLLTTFSIQTNAEINSVLQSRLIGRLFPFKQAISYQNISEGNYCAVPLDLSLGTLDYVPANYSDLKTLCVIIDSFSDFPSITSKYELLAWLRWFFGRTSVPSTLFDALSQETLEQTSPILIPVLSQYAYSTVGAIQLRQLRTRQGSCGGSSTKECNEFITNSNMQTDPFIGVSTGTVYEFTRQSAAAKTIQVGSDNYTFPGFTSPQNLVNPLSFLGGYSVLFPGGDLNNSVASFETLLQDKWIDESTTWVFVEFVLYTKNNPAYVSVKLSASFSASGETKTEYTINSFSTSINGNLLYVVTAFASCLLMFYLYYFAEEAKTSSFLEAFLDWSFFDICNIILVLASLSQLYSRIDQPYWLNDTPMSSLMTFVNNGEYVAFLSNYAQGLLIVRSMQSFSLLISYLKFFKYTIISKRMYVAFGALSRTTRRVLSWLIIVLLLDFAFSFFLWFSWGVTDSDYATFGSSFLTITYLILGFGSNAPIQIVEQFQLDEMIRRPYSAFMFVFFLYFLFIAILVTSNFQGIILFGYKLVYQDQKAAEYIEREQISAREQSRTMTGTRDFWHSISSIYRDLELSTREQQKLVAQLKTAPELNYRHLLNFNELRSILTGILGQEERANKVTIELMILYQAKLRRIDDAMVIFKQQELAFGQQDPFAVKVSDLPIVASSDAEGYDPFRNELWIHDLKSGDVIRSWCFVHSLKVEALLVAMEEKSHELSLLQRDIHATVSGLENNLYEFEQSERASPSISSTVALAIDDPWEPQPESCVLLRRDNTYDAHHVSDKDKSHRYLGSFDTPEFAWRMIKKKDVELGTNKKKQYPTDL